MSPATTSGPGAPRAWARVAHQREGGTTPWSQWTGTAPETGRLLPGAQHLALLRPLNPHAARSAAPR
ncbi:MAG: hypothetical protein LH468_07970, partial [Nocardioides sp.]|nr:hypothetical protein [Nocardioides sp.]